MKRRDFLKFSITLTLAFGGCLGAPRLSDVKIEQVATNLQVPWDMDFSPDGRIFFTERVGRVRVIDGKLLPKPFATPKASPIGEGGVLGLALHPDFPTNPFVYVYYTYSEDRRLLNRVGRFTEEDNRAVEEEIILEGIPGGAIHNGGRISFGPEGYLYITT